MSVIVHYFEIKCNFHMINDHLEIPFLCYWQITSYSLDVLPAASTAKIANRCFPEQPWYAYCLALDKPENSFMIQLWHTSQLRRNWTVDSTTKQKGLTVCVQQIRQLHKSESQSPGQLQISPLPFYIWRGAMMAHWSNFTFFVQFHLKKN